MRFYLQKIWNKTLDEQLYLKLYLIFLKNYHNTQWQCSVIKTKIVLLLCACSCVASGGKNVVSKY